MAGIRRDPARRHAEYAGLVLSVMVLAAGLVVVARPVTATQFATLHPLRAKPNRGLEIRARTFEPR